ncbi:hypothetical protein [Blastomonas fulva]|jgi:hypothetical protein|uniref:hypothetical protein n=1 Tax=Blastomonas fulva TaxID=1550728 RepID=UPI003D267142
MDDAHLDPAHEEIPLKQALEAIARRLATRTSLGIRWAINSNSLISKFDKKMDCLGIAKQYEIAFRWLLSGLCWQRDGLILDIE